MPIKLDKQVVSKRCPECEMEFSVVRGSVFDGSEGVGLYLIALHGHSPEGRLGHLAVAILDPTAGIPRPIAAAMDVIATPEQYRFALVDWDSSPWNAEKYLGEMLGADEARKSPYRAGFFHIADHVVQDIPEVRAYLG